LCDAGHLGLLIVSRPNDQAAALILLVRKYPDTLKRLQHLAVAV
jgi:hypothetical protein